MLAQWTEGHMDAVREARHRFDTGEGEPAGDTRSIRPTTDGETITA
jgi:hypothetical protein